MPRNLGEPILLLGAGYMATEYAKVLSALEIPFICVGRSREGTFAFQEKTGHEAIPDGLEKYMDKNAMPSYAIVTVNAIDSSEAVVRLLEGGVKHILAEKPCGLNIEEVRRVAKTTEKYGAETLVAYNRRFYASVLAAEEIIREQGGVDSMMFEFTEWLHVIKGATNATQEKNALLQCNSAHVIDLAFHLCGRPKELTCFTKGPADWYGEARAFSGAGETEKGALFSYSANWTGPGRWGLEIVAGSRRLIFRPLEQLHIQEMKSVNIKRIDIDDELDIDFKPGLYKQTQAFLNGNDRDRMLNIAEQLENSRIYARIAGLV